MLIARCDYLLLSVFVVLLFSLYFVNICSCVYVDTYIHLCIYAYAHIHMKVDKCDIFIFHV